MGVEASERPRAGEALAPGFRRSPKANTKIHSARYRTRSVLRRESERTGLERRRDDRAERKATPIRRCIKKPACTRARGVVSVQTRGRRTIALTRGVDDVKSGLMIARSVQMVLSEFDEGAS